MENKRDQKSSKSKKYVERKIFFVSYLIAKSKNDFDTIEINPACYLFP